MYVNCINLFKSRLFVDDLESAGVHTCSNTQCPPYFLSDRRENEISKIRYLNKAGGTRPAMARAIL